jgi:hypothetical protein
MMVRFTGIPRPHAVELAHCRVSAAAVDHYRCPVEEI